MLLSFARPISKISFLLVMGFSAVFANANPPLSFFEASWSNDVSQEVTLRAMEQPDLFCATLTRVQLAKAHLEFKAEDRVPSESEIDDKFESMLAHQTPWAVSLIPTLEAKYQALENALDMMPVTAERYERPAKVRELLVKPIDSEISKAYEQWIESASISHVSFRQLKQTRLKYSKFATGLLARYSVCKFYGATDTSSCTKALQGILGDMSVVQDPTQFGVIDFSLVEETETLLQSDNLQEGLRRSAILLLSRSDIKAAQQRPEADLFNDLMTSFKSTGLSDIEATEAVWSTLGVVSTSGANLIMRLNKIDIQKRHLISALSLGVIAAVLPLLDTQYSGSGHFYSYPPSVKSHCDTAKSYHFWMAAYLARRRVQAGVDPISASEATFISNIGYRIFDQEVSAHLAESSRYSPMINLLRADFSYAAAGAIYGANSVSGARSSPYLIDEGIRHAIQAPAAASSESYLESAMSAALPTPFGIWRFNWLTAPMDTFKFYLN